MSDIEGRRETESMNEKKTFKDTETSKKIIRLITVVVYLILVSATAIILSLYYLFFWNPTVQSGAEKFASPIQLHLSEFYFNVTQKVSRGSTNGAVGSEIKFAGNDKEKMYEPKHRRKLVRVLTVIAYLFSVSLAAIMLSLFYVFIYNPGKSAGGNSHDLLPSQINYHEISQGSMESVNETLLILEREEPRALPVNGFKNPFLDKRHSEDFPENNQIYVNYSVAFGKENKTNLHKIIKSLKEE